ncbi:MAG: hypothetical protein K6E33_01995 [Lachnospiraceae bacterium]|nr:hypothetical protein [Lachnospiraceae bacterium]
MTVEAYMNPELTWVGVVTFICAIFLGIVFCMALILGAVRLFYSSYPETVRKRLLYEKGHTYIEQFYEMIIAGTSVMSFSCAYVILNHIYSLMQEGEVPGPVLSLVMAAWKDGRDFVLLFLICISCVLNSILDRVIIPLSHLNNERRGIIRMLAMFYVIIILMFLDWIGDEDAYNPVMMYYLGLMVGRFVYFDASFGDFVKALKNMFEKLPLLLLGLSLTGILCWYGFDSGFLLERNFYIVGAFYTHILMVAVIFVIHLSHILNLIIRKPRGYEPPAPENYPYK